MITGRLMEDGHLIKVQLYTEWDDNHVYLINQWKVLLLKKSPANRKIIDNTVLLNRDILWQKVNPGD